MMSNKSTTQNATALQSKETILWCQVCRLSTVAPPPLKQKLNGFTQISGPIQKWGGPSASPQWQVVLVYCRL